MKNRKLLSMLLTFVVALLPASAFASATISIFSDDPPGTGFFDPTPAAPVGGNPGTTLGDQRIIAYLSAGDKWGATLDSVPAVTILARWQALACTPTAATLGSAGATEVFRDFPGAAFANTWYSGALASKLFGADLDPATPQILARFNVNLGNTGCLDGTHFYLGLDGNHGNDIDLVTVLTHEFGHGLGFQTFTNGTSGAFFAGFPTVFDNFLLDDSTNKLWVNMTPAERATSALNSRKLVWNGPHVTAAVPVVLAQGTPLVTVSLPASVAGTYQVGTASFGPLLNSPGVTAEVMPVVDQPNGTGLACTPLSAANAAAVSGKIALVDRGVCTFNVKALNVQNAGAKAVIVADNVAGSPPAGLGGTDPTITIPAVRITLQDGNTLKAALATRSRLHSGMFANLGLNLAVRSGADAANHAMMYAPNPFASGSSVSHYDTLEFPNQLMEPFINADLTHEVTPPFDMTFQLLQDIGW